jgi:MFS family permease
LRIPDYRRLLISNGLWWQARFMENLAAGWLVLEMTDSAWHVALVGFYRMAPLMIVGFFSGIVADRFGRRAVILFSQTVNLIVPLAVAFLVLTDLIEFRHVAVASAVMGTVWALDWPARRSILPDLVGKARTADGMLLEGFFQNTSRIVGPFLGGALVRLLGTGGCFAVIALISGSGLLILKGLPKPKTRPPELQRPRHWKAVLEGMGYIRRNQTILGVFLITIVMNNLFFPYMSLLPVFARDVLGQGPVGLGLLGAGHGVGCLLGLLVVTWTRRLWKPTWLFAAGSFFQSAVLVAFAISRSFPLSVVLLFLSGLAQSSFGVMQSTIVLVSATDEMRARSMGAVNFAIGAGSLGRIEVGALASALGAPLAVGLACGTSALLVFAITAGLPGFRRT